METTKYPLADRHRRTSVFCDLSNIYCSLQNLYTHESEGLRVHFAHLNELLVGPGRTTAQRPLWIASDRGAGRVNKICCSTDRLGMNLVVRSRNNGRETDVDELLLSGIHDVLDSQVPAVLVIATGDGAGSFRDQGFLAACHRARELGWAVEIFAWTQTCHKQLRVFAEQGNGFTDLNRHFGSVTYVEGRRLAAPVSWKRRALATFPESRVAA
jgi:hypothetical protein